MLTEHVAHEEQVPHSENPLWLEEDLDALFEKPGDVFMMTACEKSEIFSASPGFIGASTHEATRDKAIIDCGASESIVGANMLQDFCDTLSSLGFDPQDEVQVDRQITKSFIFGNNETSSSLGLAKVNAGVCGSEHAMDLHVVEGSTPFLLSSRWLWEQEAVINFKTGKAIFPKISDKQIQLERAPTFHLLLPLTAFEGNHGVTDDVFVDPKDDDVPVRELHCQGQAMNERSE